MPPEIINSYDILIEIMVRFGLTLKKRASLLLEQQAVLRIEMNVATKIQNRLLKSTIPKIVGIDIGFVSIPSRRMNGDYVHFLFDKKNYVSVAVTDVVGEGIVAALCMSMVKNGLDTLEFTKNNPSFVLEVLNQVIEKSVDDSLFVSVFYGRYDSEEVKLKIGPYHENVELLREGGLGIYLMKSLLDEVKLNNEGGVTVFMTKICRKRAARRDSRKK